jgi:MATE family multidrug resistance protein
MPSNTTMKAKKERITRSSSAAVSASVAASVLLLCTANLFLSSGVEAYQQPTMLSSGSSPVVSPISPSSSLYSSMNHRRRQKCRLQMSGTAAGSSSFQPSPNEHSSVSPLSRNVSLGASIVESASDRLFGHRLQNFKRRFLQRKQQAVDHDGRATHAPDYQWNKQNLAIALPALLGLLADPMLSMVDTAFVGRSGPIDLAALGVCTSIFHMAFTVFRASTVATTSLVGSAETQEEKRQITKISLGFAGVMGSLVLLALRFGGSRLLATMGVSSSSPLYKPACDYLFARCWAAPAVVGLVVAEGAFRGNDDNKTPLIAASVAAAINLVLDPLLMFPLGMGMAGAAWATALSQFGAAGMYAWRLWKRQLLPQAADTVKVNVGKILKSILGANAAMLAKNFSMLVFYTAATAVATRLGPVHVATHQVCLSLFWLVTMWLDSGSVSAQLLLSKNMNEPQKAKSLTKYMIKFALAQGLTFSAIVAAVGRFVPSVFTSDPTVTSYILQCLPHLALQQTIVSLCLVLEGLAIGGNQFRFTAAGTALSTAVGLWKMTQASSVVDIWASAVNAFFGMRLLTAVIGVARLHMGLGVKQPEDAYRANAAEIGILDPPLVDTTNGFSEVVSEPSR